jgi:hypothetical protein
MKAAILAILALTLWSAPASPRTWTNTEGKKIEAEILRVTAKEAVLKVGATEHKVPLAKLSEEDKKWIADNASLSKKSATAAEIDLCFRCGGNPNVKQVQATVKKVDFKSSEKAFIVLDGGVVIELAGKDYVLDAGALYHVPTPTPRDASIVRAKKKRIIGTGDSVTITAEKNDDLTFRPAVFGLDTLWQVTNASMRQAVQEAVPKIPVPGS